MSEEERAQVLVTARLLASADRIDWLSMAITVIAAFAWDPEIIVLGLLAKFFAVRIALDARLLDDIAADRITTNAFDDAAVALRLMPARKAGRSWNARCRGAIRLFVIFAALTALQVIALSVRSFLR